MTRSDQLSEAGRRPSGSWYTSCVPVPKCASTSASTSRGGSSRSGTASSTVKRATSRLLDANHRWPRIHSCSRSSGSCASRSEPSAMPFALSLDELEPVEAARREGEQVGPLADAREPRAPEDLDRVAALVLRQV